MALLTVANISVNYGPTQALFDVSLTVKRGGVTALLGRNGVGKSTTIKSICRMLPHASGSITFDNKPLTHLTSHQAARLGLGLVPEGRRCFNNLTVQQNLTVAERPGHWNFSKVTTLFPRLAERKNQQCATLSGGEQQMVAIGRALMTNPKLLILDEATEGLAPIVRQEIWSAIRTLKETQNLSILVVDKSLKDLSKVADQAVVLSRGATMWSGAMADLTDSVTAQYIGV